MSDPPSSIPSLTADLALVGYGVRLERLELPDLEFVRRLRTMPAIAQYMRYRDPITPEEQQRWFEGLDPQRDLYFVVKVDGRPCGLSNVRSIDWKRRSFESGIFLDPQYWNTDIALRAVFCASDFAYGDLALTTSTCTVLVSNVRAVRFNLNLGYRVVETVEDGDPYLRMRAERSDYERMTLRLRDYLRRCGRPRPVTLDQT